MMESVHIRFNTEANEVQFFVQKSDGTGDRLIAVLPATPPPDADE